MTPSQRRKKLATFRAKKAKKGFSWPKIIVLLLTLFAFFGYILLTSRFFNKNSKLSVVINKGDQIIVSTFDKKEGSITNIIIPGETQVSVSRQLGTWKIGSVWKLGENEKLSGTLLAETVIKNFRVPVGVWADGPFYGISEGELLPVFRALFGYKTNLGVGDRVRLGLFSLGVPPIQIVNIDLSSQNFLKETKLVGGEMGYVISSGLPESLSSIFSDTQINSLKPRILIEDYQTKREAVDTLVETLEVLGGKVTSITSKGAKEFYCEVSGVDKYTIEKVASIFGCVEQGQTADNNFDLTIKVGEEFGKRF